MIGGGPAGMKAACTAAERGHRVTLVEKEDHLGGQLLLNRCIPGREEMVTAAEDLIRNLQELQVEILLGKRAEIDFIKGMAADAVVVATGARPMRPDIRGIESSKVIQAWDVLKGEVGVGRRVVVVGGNAVGLETALYLASRGTLSPQVLHFLMANQAESLETLSELVNRGCKEVTVVEMLAKTGKDIGPSTRWTVMAELKRLGVRVLINTKAVAIEQEGLEVEKEDGPGFLPADSIVLAVGSEPENALVERIKKVAPEVHAIGDAKEPRKALEAIREGFLAGLRL